MAVEQRSHIAVAEPGDAGLAINFYDLLRSLCKTARVTGLSRDCKQLGGGRPTVVVSPFPKGRVDSRTSFRTHGIVAASGLPSFPSFIF